eukprot:2509543-Ditylum_brightwellii.AAC.1
MDTIGDDHYKDDNERIMFRNHVFKNILLNDDRADYLPVAVFTYTKPMQNVLCLLHLMLSMGCSQTEVDLMLHSTKRECLRYAKLMGESNDIDLLVSDVNKLIC